MELEERHWYGNPKPKSDEQQLNDYRDALLWQMTGETGKGKRFTDKNLQLEVDIPEIYQQLKDRDNADAKMDSPTAEALTAVLAYQGMLKNPESIQVRSAIIVDFTVRKDSYHAVCLVIGGQNGFGGIATRGTAYVTYGHDGKTKSMWTESEAGLGRNYENMCFYLPHAFADRVPRPGTDVTSKVQHALQIQAAKN